MRTDAIIREGALRATGSLSAGACCVKHATRATLLATVAVGLTIASGCTPQGKSFSPHETQFSDHPRTVVRPQPTPAEAETITFGKSVAGRPLTATIHGSGEQTILVLATIHGSESAGTPLLRKLDEYLTSHPDAVADKRVIVVPVVNPDGMSANTRVNLHGVDLNRNFPAWNFIAFGGHGRAALSEPESRALHDLIIKYAPKRIITIHQPLTCIDYDGHAETLARAMATNARLPLKKLGSLAGSLGSFAGVNRRVPVVTVEFPRAADDLTAEGLWSRYGRMLLIGICYPEPAPSLVALSVPRPSESASPSAADTDIPAK